MLGRSGKKKAPAKRRSEPKLTSGKKPASASRKGVGSVSPRKEAAKRPAPKRKRTTKKSGSAGGKRPFILLRRSFWMFMGSLAFTGIIIAMAAVLYFAQDLPSISGLETIKKQPGITIKTDDGLTLASYGDIYGDYVSYEDLPPHLIHAVMATEDRRFFDHFGIDLIGIARAMVVNIKAGRFVQGGSTITQQVAKNVFLTPERTIKRKIQEMLLAFWLEGRFTKEQILAIYLNRVYLGAGNYGVDAASRRYFDKPATEMNLIESAIITGLLKAPSKYSPIANKERSLKRAHQVLLNMEDAGYITDIEVSEALEQFQPPKLYREDNPSGTRYFTDWIMDELPQYIGNVEQDLVVFTTLDPTLQKEAEDALNKVIEENGEEKKASQAALLSMKADGAVKAMVGGRSYLESQFNRATQANRQPGSVFKLFVYLAALDAGLTPETLVMDEPLELQVGRRMWRPKNFGNEYRGEITIREGLTHSVNTIAVQLAMAVGVDKVVEMARRLGVVDVEPKPSIALGAVEANLLELTTAYAHLANQGRGVQAYGIDRIVSQDGEELYKRSGSGLWVVLRNNVVQQMNYMLMNVPVEGTGRRANIGRPVAGKTGTSSDYKDAWFIGFTPQYVTGVWVGNDDNRKMKRVTGGNLPAMIWKEYMVKALKGKAVKGIPSSLEVQEENLPWQDGDGIQTLEDLIDRIDGEFNAPQPQQPENGNQEGPDLRPSFWDKLFKGKTSGNVEYDYPTSSGREKRLER